MWNRSNTERYQRIWKIKCLCEKLEMLMTMLSCIGHQNLKANIMQNTSDDKYQYVVFKISNYYLTWSIHYWNDSMVPLQLKIMAVKAIFYFLYIAGHIISVTLKCAEINPVFFFPKHEKCKSYRFSIWDFDSSRCYLCIPWENKCTWLISPLCCRHIFWSIF